MSVLKWAILGMAIATPALAEVTQIKGNGSVAEVMDALEGAVEAAGATVFARIDHAAGAATIGETLNDAEVLIFGNPALGTPAIQQDALAGLYLPLKVLVYEDGDGQTWLAYEDPAEMMEDLSVDQSAEFMGKMQGALKGLTGKAGG
ncbi:MAG: DUF302 domain-containing protein [Paracoccaceae bacterium]